MTEPTHAIPRDGGSYRREPDGSLTLLEPTTAPPPAKQRAAADSRSVTSPEEALAETVTTINRRSRREPQE